MTDPLRSFGLWQLEFQIAASLILAAALVARRLIVDRDKQVRWIDAGRRRRFEAWFVVASIIGVGCWLAVPGRPAWSLRSATPTRADLSPDRDRVERLDRTADPNQTSDLSLETTIRPATTSSRRLTMTSSMLDHRAHTELTFSRATG
jgi:hypothetical protein